MENVAGGIGRAGSPQNWVLIMDQTNLSGVIRRL